MTGLRNITAFNIETEDGPPRKVPLSEDPTRLLTALLDHPDGLPEDAAHRLCDDVPTAARHLQRAGLQVVWRQQEGRSVIALAPGQSVEKAYA